MDHLSFAKSSLFRNLRVAEKIRCPHPAKADFMIFGSMKNSSGTNSCDIS
jgi:hypothetical protein